MCTVKIIDYVLNADLNKKVFNVDIKITKKGYPGLPVVNYSISVFLKIPGCLFLKVTSNTLTLQL